MALEVEMEEEWTAWRNIVLELERLGIDINTQERLASAIVMWGELLVSLRIAQTPDIRLECLGESLRKFHRAFSS